MSITGSATVADGLTIEVTGVLHVVQASPDTPVLYVLRDELQLNCRTYPRILAAIGSRSVVLQPRMASLEP